MLRDLLRSFPLSKLPEIDKLYLGQMRVIISYCRNLNMRVEDQSSLEKVNDAIRSVVDVLYWIIPQRSSPKEKERQLRAQKEFDSCVKQIRKAIEDLCGSDQYVAESFDEQMSREKGSDSEASEKAKLLGASLKAKLSDLRKAPKRTIEFWIWDRYIPPVDLKDVQHHVSRRLFTFEEGTNLATAMVYFLANLKADPKKPRHYRWSEKGSAILDSVLFYTNFPVTQRELSENEGRIPALSLATTIQQLAETAMFMHRDVGKSEAKPLQVQVLADRDYCMFLESLDQKRVIGNIFKISDAYILRDKLGNLLSTNALPELPKYEDVNRKSQPQASILRLDPVRRQQTLVTDVRTWAEMFEKVVQTPYESDDVHWWYKLASQTIPWFSQPQSPQPNSPSLSGFGPSIATDDSQMLVPFVASRAAAHSPTPPMRMPVAVIEPRIPPSPPTPIATPQPTPSYAPLNQPSPSGNASNSMRYYKPNLPPDPSPRTFNEAPRSQPPPPVDHNPQRLGVSQPITQLTKDKPTVAAPSAAPAVRGRFQSTSTGLRTQIGGQLGPGSASLANHVFRPNIPPTPPRPTPPPPKEKSKKESSKGGFLSGLKKKWWG